MDGMSEHPAVAHIRKAHRISENHARKATPGPWETEGDDPTDDQVMTVHDGEHGDWVGGTVAFVRSGAWGRQTVEGRTQANMCLIADHAAPDAVLRRIEAERELLARSERILAVEGWEYDDAPRLAEQVITELARGWGWTEEEQP